MANENSSTYELEYGVKALFDEKASLICYARMRATQLEALTSYLSVSDPTSHPDSLVTDVLWLAASLSREMKELVEALYKGGKSEALASVKLAKLGGT